ncbi:transcription factor 19 isoform X7 [Homo sapiens]|uniref:transcription factor 19 isoform X2 n=1 Tax=Homo sapiens TaxID=9606 RepID=UPI0003EB0056|nr:transcription factor 19 isoform X2 [Homo sapiens]XP_054186598.1 transcription factor 19 isoform X3 [Homo sapiens]XP_054186833.1 transcription factor 19 isoform X4 [Homo sapiens]XP_054187094.1 transcription factor 19 isoform X5 [Homo sapiens]XP_054187353.1 transcription factor 19 isoform X6 [Homo sapiens]XP_054212249.1 transcription factor 19 isoform X7 [Homo sapiens]
MLPCFQLLRIGGGRGGDLYTFHPPAGAGCTYRLGHRADLCDVALRPQQEPGLISGIHAELHAEPRGDDWRVSLEDHSSQGTLVNNVRLPRGHRLELSDGDLLTFGPEGPPGTSPSEFYFMFQQAASASSGPSPSPSPLVGVDQRACLFPPHLGKWGPRLLLHPNAIGGNLFTECWRNWMMRVSLLRTRHRSLWSPGRNSV